MTWGLLGLKISEPNPANNLTDARVNSGNKVDLEKKNNVAFVYEKNQYEDNRRITRVYIGNGRSTSFWHDHWLGPMPLVGMFPALFSHCDQPQVLVAACKAGDVWNLHLHHHLSAQELLTLAPALAAVDLDIHSEDQRGIGETMAPYSSARAYQWHME